MSVTEQHTGLNEVNSAANPMDQTTQRNAAMVEQSNAQFLRHASLESARYLIVQRPSPGYQEMSGVLAAP